MNIMGIHKAYFEKNRFGVTVFDMTDYAPDMRIMFIQFWLKTGFAIIYKLTDRSRTTNKTKN